MRTNIVIDDKFDAGNASRDRLENEARGCRRKLADSPAPEEAIPNPHNARQTGLEGRSQRHAERLLILVDSSVWIDYFHGTVNAQTDKLDSLLGREPLAIGDLILTEVLQGFDNDRDFHTAQTMLTSLLVVDLGGRDIAIRAARNCRALRKLGLTVRKDHRYRHCHPVHRQRLYSAL
jgi:predicted nucleic acid-binding protein